MNKGYFITFEGTDGCGKTTQIELVKNYLEQKGYSVLTTREPGGQRLGCKLREILLHYDGEISSNCELFLYLADRAQHVDTVIKPALEKGTIVLCDRHTDSTIAYQGYGRGLDIEQLKMLNSIATAKLVPDLTLYYDVSIATGRARVGKETDRLESEKEEFFVNVKKGFTELAKQNPQRIKVINAEKNIQEVFSDSVKEINALLEL